MWEELEGIAPFVIFEENLIDRVAGLVELVRDEDVILGLLIREI